MSDLNYKTKNFWEIASSKERKDAFKFCNNYINFLNECKTEFETVGYAEERLKAEGFKELERIKQLKIGDKVYYKHASDSVLFAFVITEKALKNGFTIVASHVDSPRLDLKMKPLAENSGICYLKTQYYGGIKKYQWVTIPLALHGRIALKDGTLKSILIGEDDSDPVFTITDLLPHLARKQMEKNAKEVVEGEELQLLFGTIPKVGETKSSKKTDIKDAVKQNILTLLNKKYGVVEQDLLSADIRVVPAYKPRSLGLDESMILAYGHDDRVCAYTSLIAFLEVSNSDKLTQANNGIPTLIFVDKEEIGSTGVTGAKSNLLTYAFELVGEKLGYSTFDVKKALFKSKALSSDVDVLLEPLHPEVTDTSNTAEIGHGGILVKYTGSGGKYNTNDADIQYMAYVMNLFDKAKVVWQTGTLGRIDVGGGGTIAMYIAQLGIRTIDFGTGVLSMHAPLEVVSKADVYSTYKAYLSFYKG